MDFLKLSVCKPPSKITVFCTKTISGYARHSRHFFNSAGFTARSEMTQKYPPSSFWQNPFFDGFYHHPILPFIDFNWFIIGMALLGFYIFADFLVALSKIVFGIYMDFAVILHYPPPWYFVRFYLWLRRNRWRLSKLSGANLMASCLRVKSISTHSCFLARQRCAGKKRGVHNGHPPLPGFAC